MPRKAKVATIITLLLLLLLLVVIAGVLLVYDTAKGAVLSLRYNSKVSSHFKQDFDAINPRLQNDYGIVFGHNDKDCGSRSGYSSAGTYIFTCTNSVRAEPVVADEAFVKKWRETSPELERYLLAKGWQKEWNQHQPINEILDKFNNSSSIGVNYAKRHGKITCRLSLTWLRPETPNHLIADEVCEMSQRTWGW